MEVKARVVENVWGQWFACYTSESIGPFDTKEKAEAALLNQGAVSNEPPTRPAVKLPSAEEICAFNKIDDVNSNYGGVVKETLEAIRQLQA